MYNELLSLIKPALDEMVREGFAATWRITHTQNDLVEFKSDFRPGVSILWDGSSPRRWAVFGQGPYARGATLAEAARSVKALGVVL